MKSTYHTVCQAPPLLKMSPQAFICGLKAQAPNEQLAKLLRLARDLHNGQSKALARLHLRNQMHTEYHCDDDNGHNKPLLYLHGADRV